MRPLDGITLAVAVSAVELSTWLALRASPDPVTP